MKKWLVHVLLVLMLCSLVLVLPTAAAVNGKIAFVSYRDGNSEIYMMNPDGTGQTRLTNNPARDIEPAWSPDGTKIAFVSNRDGNYEIYFMNADGTGQKNLTNNPADDYNPAWSPDGKKIAFSSTRIANEDIYVMNSVDETIPPTRLTDNKANDYNPAWSPDGKKIAFSSTFSDPLGDIYVINADGTGQKDLTNNPASDASPAWSPDGTKIVFRRIHTDSDDGNDEIYLMNADGTGQKDLTNNLVDDNSAVWSPDGTKIAFISNRNLGNYEIYVMNPDGTGQTPLSNAPIYGYYPAWGPAIYSITVTSPNGGESWQRGTSNMVTWSYTGNPGSTVKIVLLKAGTEVGTIASSVSIGSGGHGSYTWAIYPSGTTGSDYKVSVQSISQPTVKDTSNNYFTLTSVPPPSSITLASPNGGEIWQRGTFQTVTWDYTGTPGSTVKIELLKGGTPVGTATYSTSIGANGKGSYTWAISSVRALDKDYQILVQSISQPTIKDTSDNYFTITSGTPVTIPSITVTSPNGGESWQRGTTQTVTWTYTGTPGTAVKLILLKAGAEVGTIVGGVSIGTGGTGSYTWAINPSGSTGGDYSVSVQSISQPTIKDTSNGYFTLIPAGTITSSISVTAPNGGETWKRGTTQTIKWSYTGTPGSYLKIELLQGSTPVGTATYSTSIGTGGIGSYPWAISSARAPGTNYRIRITSVSQPTISDTSNGDFTITT